MKRLSSYIILFILLLQGLSAVPVYSQDETKEYYVVYDQGHGQFFDEDLMSTALNSLASAFDNITINLCATLVDRTNARLFGDPIRGEMLTFDIESKDEVLEGKVALHEQGPGTEPSKVDVCFLQRISRLRESWDPLLPRGQLPQILPADLLR